MYIVVEHEISDPKTFWDTAQEGMSNLPDGLKTHQVFPNSDGTKAVCLWEADGVEDVESFIEGAVGQVSRNTYYPVEEENAVRSPATAGV